MMYTAYKAQTVLWAHQCAITRSFGLAQFLELGRLPAGRTDRRRYQQWLVKWRGVGL